MPKTEIDTIREQFAALEAAYVKAEAELAVRDASGSPFLLVPHLAAVGRARLNRNDKFVVEYQRGSAWLSADEFIEHLKADETLRKAFAKPTTDPNSSLPKVRNPYKKGPAFNLTEQMRLQRENPNLAASLKAAAEAGSA